MDKHVFIEIYYIFSICRTLICKTCTWTCIKLYQIIFTHDTIAVLVTCLTSSHLVNVTILDLECCLSRLRLLYVTWKWPRRPVERHSMIRQHLILWWFLYSTHHSLSFDPLSVVLSSLFILKAVCFQFAHYHSPLNSPRRAAVFLYPVCFQYLCRTPSVFL